MDVRSKTILSYALLVIIMIANALLMGACIASGDTTRATFYGFNVITVILLFGTLAVQSYGYRGKPDESRRETPYLYSVIGVMAGVTLILSTALGFGKAPSVNDPIIFLFCVAILVVYVYIIILRDHS